MIAIRIHQALSIAVEYVYLASTLPTNWTSSDLPTYVQLLLTYLVESKATLKVQGLSNLSRFSLSITSRGTKPVQCELISAFSYVNTAAKSWSGTNFYTYN